MDATDPFTFADAVTDLLAGEVALAVARRRGARASAGAGPRRPQPGHDRGPAPNLYELPEDAPFAYERAWWPPSTSSSTPTATPRATNPERGHELLASATSVAAPAVTAHRTHQPYPWPPDQISFIEVYVLRVLAVFGLAVSILDGSWWAHLATRANSLPR